MIKKVLVLAIATAMAFSAMAGSGDTLRKEKEQTSFGMPADNDYNRRTGFLLHLGANNGLGIGAGYQFNPFVQAYGEVGLGGYTVGARYYANEKKWSFMADLAIGAANSAKFADGKIETHSGFALKGIVGASYKTFDFGIGGWLCEGKPVLSVMAEWNIRFGRD